LDARSAHLIVGTSAGSITGTLPRPGVSAADLEAWTVKAPLSGDEGLLRQTTEMMLPDLHRSTAAAERRSGLGPPTVFTSNFATGSPLRTPRTIRLRLSDGA
jgi:NTE family protein